MKKAMLTGATGFVGANLARRLIGDGRELHILVRRGYNPWRIETIKDSLRVHEVDLNDAKATASVVANICPDEVFHLAAFGAYSWQTDLEEMIRTNFTGTVNLVEACAKAGCSAFINAGTSSEYGYKDHAPRESEILEPNSYYAVTKAAATQYCRFMAQKHNMHIVTLRLYSAYGPYEDPKRLIPALIVKGLECGLPPLAGPSVARDYIFVDDVCDAFVATAAKHDIARGSIYNIGTGVQTSLEAAVEIARRAMNISAQPVWNTMKNRSWDTSVWVANAGKIKTELGWAAKYSFEEGFKKTVEWFKANSYLRDIYKR